MAEPSLLSQLAELLILTLLANAALLARKAVSASLKEGSSFFLEGIRRDSPPGLQLENLSSAGAYDLGGTCLVVGVQHFLGALLCLPEVTRSVSNDWSAALIRHAALLAAALGVTQVLAAVRRHFAEDGPKHMPLSLLAYLDGFWDASLWLCSKLPEPIGLDHRRLVPSSSAAALAGRCSGHCHCRGRARAPPSLQHRNDETTLVSRRCLAASVDGHGRDTAHSTGVHPTSGWLPGKI
eukprot:s952_g4.t2